MNIAVILNSREKRKKIDISKFYSTLLIRERLGLRFPADCWIVIRLSGDLPHLEVVIILCLASSDLGSITCSILGSVTYRTMCVLCQRSDSVVSHFSIRGEKDILGEKLIQQMTFQLFQGIWTVYSSDKSYFWTWWENNSLFLMTPPLSRSSHSSAHSPKPKQIWISLYISELPFIFNAGGTVSEYSEQDVHRKEMHCPSKLSILHFSHDALRSPLF